MDRASQMEHIYVYHLHAVFQFYLTKFKNRSMQLLTKILVLVRQNLLVIRGYHLGPEYVQDRLLQLLKKLLKDSVMERVKKNKRCLLVQDVYEKCVAVILREQLSELNRNSLSLVFDQVMPHIQN